MHPKIAAEHAAALARPDRAGAGGMVAPRDAAHEVHQLLVGLQRLARLLLRGDQALILQLCRESADKAYGGDDRSEIFACSIAALVKIMEIDQRRVQWIDRAQHDFTGAVLR